MPATKEMFFEERGLLVVLLCAHPAPVRGDPGVSAKGGYEIRGIGGGGGGRAGGGRGRRRGRSNRNVPRKNVLLNALIQLFLQVWKGSRDDEGGEFN